MSTQGFTLIEILLVVVIILVLVGLVGPRIAGRGKKAKIDATQIQISNLETSIMEFELNAGRFPSNEEGLNALKKCPSGLDEDLWAGPYTRGGIVPTDGWKQDFRYVYPSENGIEFDLISAGPDGKFGTADDVSNIPEEDD